MAKVLLAGESWINASVDHKGYDAFPHTQIEIGCARLLEVLRDSGHDVVHMRSHDVAEDFPETMDELRKFDVVLLSDVGSNSLLLSPTVFSAGRPAPNRLKLLSDWVIDGGALMMAGGYLSFQGFQAKANYAGTALEDVLPVTIHRYDDRVEAPEGVHGTVVTDHPITNGLDRVWPILLGYQDLVPRQEATTLAMVEGSPLLAVREINEGRTLAFASDISPHWAPEEFMSWDGYQQLFDRCVRWLAKDLI